MPYNLKDYPPNWLSEIRPRILARAKNCCEECNVPNYKCIFRGIWNGIEVYQDIDFDIFRADNSEKIVTGGDMIAGYSETQQAIKIVLTISHTDHDTTHNEDSNLRALCQRCHNRHDAKYRKRNKKIKGQSELF